MYHIKFSKRLGGECVVNLTESELLKRYVEPYLNAEDIMINGTIIGFSEVTRVKITQSLLDIDNLIQKLANEDNLMPIKIIGQTSPRWRAIDEYDDVTDLFINKIPNKKPSISQKQKDDYVNFSRIEELRNIKDSVFDFIVVR